MTGGIHKNYSHLQYSSATAVSTSIARPRQSQQKVWVSHNLGSHLGLELFVSRERESTRLKGPDNSETAHSGCYFRGTSTRFNSSIVRLSSSSFVPASASLPSAVRRR